MFISLVIYGIPKYVFFPHNVQSSRSFLYLCKEKRGNFMDIISYVVRKDSDVCFVLDDAIYRPTETKQLEKIRKSVNHNTTVLYTIIRFYDNA